MNKKICTLVLLASFFSISLKGCLEGLIGGALIIYGVHKLEKYEQNARNRLNHKCESLIERINKALAELKAEEKAKTALHPSFIY